ncbi:hypothetical protein FGM00_13290 [Aggregatimonas sangjinii]|uniref:Uncharacterized protein n=1 Tax=Aggregatimonas sangjinii TaxID=2583587 RepID=A0A5B7SVJ7_9FLAO|nr:hypothetical protein [Aggregatimonas sangjinii]QCX01038.1 hypothetical protein FGM00_13290 [Aggregatimonas sangjinii]
MKYTVKIFLLAINLVIFGEMLPAQQSEISNQDYGFQITMLGIPKSAPDGYESVKTVALDKPLYPDKAYEVGFWIFGPQLADRGYSYPIQVFPSNFMGPVNSDIFNLVEAHEIMPKLEVNPPPRYTSRGYHTFTIRPDTLYQNVTVALKVNAWDRPPINIREDITVTGVFVAVVPEKSNDDNSLAQKQSIDTLKRVLPEQMAERILIDSKKSYTVTESEVSIGLYDHRNIDKDKVTIYLNAEILIEDYELKRKKKFFKAGLKPGINTITLHAENLGEVSPNTAAIIVKTKSKELTAILESDLGTSQYFTLVYKPN